MLRKAEQQKVRAWVLHTTEPRQAGLLTLGLLHQREIHFYLVYTLMLAIFIVVKPVS